jgi:hypothetical protein
MAKRVSIPKLDAAITDADRRSSELLDQLFSEIAPKEDKEFEVIDATATLMTTTTSINPARPRTLKAGYDYENEVLTVVFRDGTWWQYRDVPVELWTEFKSSESKGRFLRDSGLDTWGNMGPADVESMPKHRRELMNDLSEFTEYMYGAKPKKV